MIDDALIIRFLLIYCRWRLGSGRAGEISDEGAIFGISGDVSRYFMASTRNATLAGRA